jgi:hypothetical protein
VLPTEDLGVEITVPRGWNGLYVCLPSNFDMLIVKEGDMFWHKRVVQWVKVKSGELRLVVGRRKRRWCRHFGFEEVQVVGGRAQTTFDYLINKPHVLAVSFYIR